VNTETTEVKLPISPQEIALKMYTDLVADAIATAAKEKREPRASELRDAVVTTVECAVRASRAGAAVLFDVLAERSPDLDYRRVGKEFAEILRGERKPEVVREAEQPKIILAGG